MSKVTILSDFDGTIIPVDLSNFIYRKFTSRGLYYADLWQKGIINTQEEIQKAFATVTVGREVIATGLAGIAIDPTFHELVNMASQFQLELAVVSDGLDWAIRVVLAANGIHGLPVYANQVVFQEDQFTFEFPWYDPITPDTGVCKPLIVRKYKQAGSQVAFIGDGRSDREAAAEADLVFAKGELLDYCREDGIPALEFRNFTEICAQLSCWLPPA